MCGVEAMLPRCEVEIHSCQLQMSTMRRPQTSFWKAVSNVKDGLLCLSWSCLLRKTCVHELGWSHQQGTLNRWLGRCSVCVCVQGGPKDSERKLWLQCNVDTRWVRASLSCMCVHVCCTQIEYCPPCCLIFLQVSSSTTMNRRTQVHCGAWQS